MFASTILTICLVFSTGAVSADAKPKAEKEIAPAHQVVAIYFHRTQRCPTCKRIGGFSEEAVKEGFPEEMKARTVEFHYVDFQDKKNAKIVASYGIKTPTLVVANVFDGKTVCWAPMPKVWQLVAKPEELLAYVRAGVARYMAQTEEEAHAEREKSKESQG